MSDLTKKLCPDYRSKKYQCKRTKTTHFDHEMAKVVREDITNAEAECVFSLVRKKKMIQISGQI